MDKSPKKNDVLDVARDAFKKGTVIVTVHASERMEERDVSFFEIKTALLNGWHEKKKDEWDIDYQEWKYSLRGDVDNKRIRIIVSLINISGVLLITVIDLNKED